MGFSPEIVSTADYHMIYRTKQPVGAIYELLLLTTTFRSWKSKEKTMGFSPENNVNYMYIRNFLK